MSFNQKQQFAIRKLTVGVCSILCGMTMSMAMVAEAVAEVITPVANTANRTLPAPEPGQVPKNPTSKDYGANAATIEVAATTPWRQSFDTGDFTGAIDKTAERSEVTAVYPQHGIPFNAHKESIGSVRYKWKEKEIVAGGNYEGWTLRSGNSFNVVEPLTPEYIAVNPEYSKKTKVGENYVYTKAAPYKFEAKDRSKVYDMDQAVANRPLSAINGHGWLLRGVPKPASSAAEHASIGPVNYYRSPSSTRFVELKNEGTEIQSALYKVNPGSTIRFHFSYRSAFGGWDHNAVEGEQGIAYLVDQNGNKLTTADGTTSDITNIGAGSFGYRQSGAFYNIPDNVTGIRIVLKAGAKSKLYPNHENAGYIFDNVGLELGAAINHKQLLTKNDTITGEATYGENHVYAKGDKLKYRLEIRNDGGITAERVATKIKIPEGVSIDGDLPAGFTYDEATRTVTISPYGNHSLGVNGVRAIELNFKIDDHFEGNGVVFEARTDYTNTTYIWDNSITVAGSVKSTTSTTGVQQPLYIDSTAPAAPVLDTIDTATKILPITPPADADLKTIEVTFPDKATPVVVAKNPDGTWTAVGQPIPLVDGKLQLPIPADVTLKEGADTITAIAKDKVGNASQAGKASVTNQAPEVSVPTRSISKEKGQTINLLDGVTTTDSEDDADPQDAKQTAVKVKITSPDGASVTYLKKGNGTVVKLLRQDDGTVVEEPAQETELTAFLLDQVGEYSIDVTPVDSDGKEGATKAFTIAVVDKPEVPKVGAIDTRAKQVPITVTDKGNPSKIDVTFPGKDGNPVLVTLTKDPQTESWKTAAGADVPVAADGSLSVPIPENASLEEGKDKITVIASNGIASSDPGKGEITNQAPVITATDTKEQLIGSTVNLTTQVLSVTDKEDDADTTDANETSITAYKIRKPDGSEITLTPDEAKKFVPDQFGNYIVRVVATDSDGKVGEQVFNLPVIDRDPVFDKDKHHSATELLSLPQHTPITEADILAKITLPDGANGVAKVIGTIPTTDIPGNKGTVAVQIDYPDGTSELVEVPVVVTLAPKMDKDRFKSGAARLTVLKDTMLTDTDILNKVTIPTGSNGIPKVIGKLPETGTPGDKGTVAVQIDYPDGTSELVEVPVIVTDTPITEEDRDKYKPATALLVVPQDAPIKPDDILAKLTIPTGSNGVATVIGTIPTTHQAGDRGTVTVQIDYPDGTSDVVEVAVMVTPTLVEDKDKYQPGAGSITIPQHSPLTEADILAKVTIPARSGARLKVLDPVPTTDSPGDKGKVRVEVVYPDGTSEIVEVAVAVIAVTPKDPILPTVTPLTVPQHTRITTENVEKQVALPVGAKIVSIGDIPSTEIPGAKPAIQVVVELLDGRTVTVAVPIMVTAVDLPDIDPIPEPKLKLKPQPQPNPQPDKPEPGEPVKVLPRVQAKVLPATGEERSRIAILLGMVVAIVAGFTIFKKKGVRKDGAE